MILTNTVSRLSQNEYSGALDNYSRAMRRISAGIKIQSSASDSGGLSQSARLKTEGLIDKAFKFNLQNTKSFLKEQENGLLNVLSIYKRMEQLSISAMSPFTNDDQRSDYDSEFKSLVEELRSIVDSTYNGQKLFDETLICGGVKNIPLGELDLVANKPSTVSHAIRAETVPLDTPAGTISFRVNSGTGGDIYRVWVGETCVFSAGGAYQGPSGSHLLQHDDPAFNFPSGNHWRTSNNAKTGDDDLFEITFAPGEQTTYKVTPGATNDTSGNGFSDFNTYNIGTGLYDVIETSNLPENSTASSLTVQIETESIGIIYSEGNSANGDADGSGTQGISLLPAHPPKSITLDHSGRKMDIAVKGFGTLYNESPLGTGLHSLQTLGQAVDTFNHLRGNPYGNDQGSYFGEMKCVLEERLSDVANEIRRIDNEISGLENKEVLIEFSQEKIQDADIAQEAVNAAKSELKMSSAAQVLNKSISVNDALIQLTQNHFDGSILKRRLI